MREFLITEFCHDHNVEDTFGVEQMSVLHINVIILISSFYAHVNVLSHLETPLLPDRKPQTSLLTAIRVLKGNQVREK